MTDGTRIGVSAVRGDVPRPVRGSVTEVPRVGYTAGVFDMFHVGHLNLLRAARARCDYLIVGVTTGALVEQTGPPPLVPMLERLAIVQSVRGVDHVVPQETRDKVLAWQSLKFDVLFVGDALRGLPEWQATTESLAELGVPVEFVPSTYRRSGELLHRGLADLVAD